MFPLPYDEIGLWHYGLFILGVIIFITLDLGVFHRKSHTVGFREALCWTTVWFSMAMAFAIVVLPADASAPEAVKEARAELEKQQAEYHAILKIHQAPDTNATNAQHAQLKNAQAQIEAAQVGVKKAWGNIEPHPRAIFITGYVLELSLSMDNVFVIALIFTFFRVESKYQHRLLFWGILGAVLMRGFMIGVGAAAVAKWHGILYLFGAFLLFTGIKMLLTDDDEGVEPEKNPLVRLARRVFPVHDQFDGEKFTTHIAGKRLLTPLAIVLITVESTDVVFAVDSIPAIFGITLDPFIVFTSNMFAIMGLRSLYFVLAGAIEYFHYLRHGLALVLAFIGAKMLAEHWWKAWLEKIVWLKETHQHLVPLVIVMAIILVSIIASLIHKMRANKDERPAS
jgi:tellurite resistance protein TerC